MKHIVLTVEELAMLRKLSVDSLRKLLELRDNILVFNSLLEIVNNTIDFEKDYLFSLSTNDLTDLALKHAFCRGQAAFGVRLLRMVKASGDEIIRREKIQKELKLKQAKNQNE